MMTEEQETTIRAFLRSRFRGYSDAIDVNETLDGVVDSLGLFELVAFTEETFKIRVPYERFHPSRFSTISHILDTIRELRQSEI